MLSIIFFKQANTKETTEMLKKFLTGGAVLALLVSFGLSAEAKPKKTENQSTGTSNSETSGSTSTSTPGATGT
ncbi:MAG TPA: hypothetical protein DEV81_16965, partial [Cyanobacteria bacterium UBA11049]|nr:hypothetical protein [Cyanobacteria bacterium UBA11049]